MRARRTVPYDDRDNKEHAESRLQNTSKQETQSNIKQRRKARQPKLTTAAGSGTEKECREVYVRNIRNILLCVILRCALPSYARRRKMDCSPSSSLPFPTTPCRSDIGGAWRRQLWRYLLYDRDRHHLFVWPSCMVAVGDVTSPLQ